MSNWNFVKSALPRRTGGQCGVTLPAHALQTAAEEAREDARALATQLQTEEGLKASLASQLQVPPPNLRLNP